MAFIQCIHIKNFRGCADTLLELSSFTPLIGYNNAGKTTILDAIEWAIQPSSLKKSDFYNPLVPVTVIFKISNVSQSIFDIEKYKKHTSKVRDFFNDGCCYFKVSQDQPDLSAQKISRHIHNPNCPIDQCTDWENPTGIKESLQVIFPDIIRIPAMSNATDDVSINKSTTAMGKLLKIISERIFLAHKNTLNEVSVKLKEIFVDDGGKKSEIFTSIEQSLTANIIDTFPGHSLKLVCHPPDMSTILKESTLLVQSGDRTVPFELMGHGLQRATQIAMLRYLSETQKEDNNFHKNYLLLIDEPELYMHPYAIVTLMSALKKLSDNNFQFVFSTHSPLTIKDSITTTKIVRKFNNTTCVLKSIAEKIDEVCVDVPSQSEILFELTNASECMFSDFILIIEGKTEARLIPALYKEYFTYSIWDARIGIIAANGCNNIYKLSKLLSCLGIRHAAIADFDFAGDHGQHIDSPCFQTAFTPLISILKSAYSTQNAGVALTGALGATRWNTFLQLNTNTTEVNEICNIFLKHNFWIWHSGDIEAQTGLTGKSIRDHNLFVTSIKEDGLAAYPTIKDCLLWINQQVQREI